MNKIVAGIVVVVVVAACGGASKPAAMSGAVTPSCEALAKACHAHAEQSAVARECHELGHTAPSEDACAARKAECLTACPSSASK